MPLRGDFGKLRTLIGGLRATANGALTRAEGRLMQDALAATREEVAACFLYQRDPSGRKWAARITVYGDFRDSNPLLFDLLSYMRFEATDGKVRVTNAKYYAFYHLTPWKRRPAREFLPTRAALGKLPQRLKIAGVRALKALLSGGSATGLRIGVDRIGT